MDMFANMFGAVTSIAVVIERLVQFLVKPAVPAKFTKAVPYVAVALGVLTAFGLNLDLLSPFLGQAGITPAVDWAGKALTGLLMGGGSNLIHDLWPGD